MSASTLQACIERHLEHAEVVFRLDNELGTNHGLSWTDFMLLTVLESAGGAARAVELARSLRIPASHLMLGLLPLEKIGMLERRTDIDGTRRIRLRPQGQRLLREARITAASACGS